MKRLIFFTAVIISLFFYLIFGYNGLLKYNEMLAIQKRYELQIREMDERIIYLERDLELLKKDNDYLEYVIRRELGLQLPSEEQYIILDEQVQSK